MDSILVVHTLEVVDSIPVVEAAVDSMEVLMVLVPVMVLVVGVVDSMDLLVDDEVDTMVVEAVDDVLEEVAADNILVVEVGPCVHICY